MREILSFQFGHYSNFIGTHLWNIQETGFSYAENSASEINHDVLFREGLTNKGEVTFTPRLLLVDLKGSLKTLPKHGELYEQNSDPKTSIAWDEGNIEVIAEETVSKNSFQDALNSQGGDINDPSITKDLNNTIKVWSDFLYSRFHPRTVNLVQDFEHENKNVPFDVFTLGRDLWKSDFSEDFGDKIRAYMEECDSLQGFHLTVDSINSFGGVATSCLEYLGDEYNKKTVLTFAAIPSYYPEYNFSSADGREESTKNDSIRLLNLALSLEAFSENSSLVIPICTGSKGWRQPGPKRNFRFVNYEPNLLYHTSAVLASALDTFTMPYRLKSATFTIGDFCADLSGNGRKVAAASLCLPFPLKTNEDLIDYLDKFEGNLWQSITPNCDISEDKVMQIITARGIDESRLKRPVHLAKQQREMPAYRCKTVQEMLTFYLSCTSFASRSHVTSLHAPLSVKTPYPNIFDDYVGTTGEIRDIPRPEEQGVKSVPVIAGCHTSSSIGDMLETLHRESARIKIARFPQFSTSGLESDEYNESLNRLLDLRECYEESFE